MIAMSMSFRVARTAPIAASMAVQGTGAIDGASQRDRSEAEDGGKPPFFVSRCKAVRRRKKAGRPSLRHKRSGEAFSGQTSHDRGRVGRRHTREGMVARQLCAPIVVIKASLRVS
ncbi:hypothetical protein D2V17_12235 [Aurantiacibacter xanthus]|uniref:Uncharacterized protein n=1 Tax=Aurantiacibacter xanthus TaxID=1784712 RepID=A0A3A1P2G9_9SPHN|nr:hypothetical protein D2V17_12235 [Aurantiacibacter xanthus]